MSITLSVVIPTYERPKLIRHALHSIAAQITPSVEVIVVNDASTQPYDIEDILPPANLVHIHTADNVGVASARNLGIAAARGTWVSFLDDDDAWCPDFIEKTLAALDNHQGPSFSWCSVIDVLYSAEGLVSAQNVKGFVNSGLRHELFQQALSIGAGYGLTVHRRCFEMAGSFDPSYRFTEDTDLVFRLLRQGYVPVIIEQPLVQVHHRHDPNRLTDSSNHARRIQDIERMLVTYQDFLRDFQDIEHSLRGYARELESWLVA